MRTLFVAVLLAVPLLAQTRIPFPQLSKPSTDTGLVQVLAVFGGGFVLLDLGPDLIILPPLVPGGAQRLVIAPSARWYQPEDVRLALQNGAVWGAPRGGRIVRVYVNGLKQTAGPDYADGTGAGNLNITLTQVFPADSVVTADVVQ